MSDGVFDAFRERVRRSLTPARRTALKPVSSVVSSLLTLLILVEATRRGQLADIAAYTAGASIGAMVSAVAGSGTSLAYVTGDAVAQNGVRRVRHVFVAPVMLVAATAAGVVYQATTSLNLIPVLIGGLAVVLNNLAELDSASLERKLETPKLLVAAILSRSVGFVALLVGAQFSSAMLICALAGYVFLRGFARAHTRTNLGSPGLRDSLRHAYAPSLMGVSLLGILVTRAALVLSPFLMSAEQAGALSTLISGQQAGTAVLTSGLYTLMAARSEAGSSMAWMRKVASRTLLVSAIIAICAALSTPIVVSVLNLTAFPEASLWWAMLGLAVFPYVYNRKVQYAFLGEGRRTRALQILGMNAALTLIVCGVAIGAGWPTALAAASLVAEGGTASAFAVVLYLHRRSSPGKTRR